MALLSESIAAKTGVSACILALAAVCLTLSPAPPEDRILDAVSGVLLGMARLPLETATLLGLLGGFILLLVPLIMAFLQYRSGARLDWSSLLGRRLWNTFIGYAFFTLIVLLVSRAQPQRQTRETEVPPPPIANAPAGAPLPSGTAPSRKSPSPVSLPLAGALLLAGAGALALAFWRVRATRVTEKPRPESTRMAEARRRLELGDRVRDAIIACYAEMCDIFTGGGPAYKNLTAREFAALLRARGAGEPEILALTSIFEKARYSDEACDEQDRAQAVEALKVLETRHPPAGGEP